MTPERWRQIEDLYHLACEKGPAVLLETEDGLRREVERLLAQHTGGGLLDQHAAKLLQELTPTRTIPGSQMALSGQTISHYQIGEMLGAGGMGVVYKAFDTKLNRMVALKFLPPPMQHDEELKRQLRDEARAASALDHPNIVVIYDIEDEADLFIAMAFHEGVTLRDKIAGGLSVPEALRIASQIASALAKAHEHGIVHRDIKPSNIMVASDGVARLIDFGLARSVQDSVKTEGTTRGTPLYMSPEQASGKAVDLRTDLWSLGAVLYEMLSGKPPFQGVSQLQIMQAVILRDPQRLMDAKPGLPPQVESIVSAALQKDPTKRYQSAGDMLTDLTAALKAIEDPPRPAALRLRYAIPAAVVILAGVAVSSWFYQRNEKRHWAREEAMPEIVRLTTQNKQLAAYRLAQEARKNIPGDPQLTALTKDLTHAVSVHSSPEGAAVEIKDYLSPGDKWFPLGTTPLNEVNIPSGYLRWRVSKPGAGEFEGAPVMADIHGFVRNFRFDLSPTGSVPDGMVAVPAAQYVDYIWSLGDFGPYDLPRFYMDRFEVTNRQYQEFVDQGGYQKREYWKNKLVRDGKELSWDQAMDLFRDSTGRAGPSTWKAGQYPSGQGDYPVGGVSWYEASAYAEFAGKSLPVIAQWFSAAPSSVAKFIMAQSNFSTSPAPGGMFKGIGPWGTYDMAGNVAEWCQNEAGLGARYLLGGAFNTAQNEYFEPGGVLPFHRGANAGFRCVRNTGALPSAALAERRQTVRDFANGHPVSDSVFRLYREMYRYDRTPLNVKAETVAQDSRDWRKEKVTFDTAYGKERMAAYLLVPANVRPPYQTVVFFPSARVADLPDSNTLGDMKFIDYVIQSGRAVLYGVYKGTYDRPAAMPAPDTVANRETMIQDAKDIGRSLDYLETRQDIDRTRIAYMGVSMGAALGVNVAAVEDRFKAVIFLDGGFYSEKPLPGADQLDFAPRVKTPALLVAGKFDWIFLDKEAMVRLLGTPAADKKVVLLDTAHDVSEQRADLVREVLGWLDKYLGKVR